MMRTFVKLQALLVAPICFLLATVSVAPAQPANPNSGARLVKDISPGAGSSTPDSLTRVGDTLFFRAFGRQLWKSDGTEAGTVMLKDFPPGPSGFTLLLLTHQPHAGQELSKSDGTAEGTVLVKDIYPGPQVPGSIEGSSFPQALINVNGTLFFTAVHPDTGRELWKSDGTPEGTVLVKDINPGTASAFFKHSVPCVGRSPPERQRHGVLQGPAPRHGVRAVEERRHRGRHRARQGHDPGAGLTHRRLDLSRMGHQLQGPPPLRRR